MQSGILSDKVIVVSGGNKGIGRAVAVEAACQGAAVVIGGRTAADGEAAVGEIESFGGTACFMRTDLRNVADCQALIECAVERYGRLDGLVNYAGILPVASLTETDEAFFDNVFDTNIKAPFFLCKHAVLAMKRTGGGSIVNAGSSHGYGGQLDRAAYAVSKGALLTLTKHIAKNYGPDHIRANWITIGWVATPGELDLRRSQGKDLEWLQKEAARYIPMGRMQTNEDNVPAFLFLLSDASGQITGSEVHVTGGMVL
jgi:NAD(P)-dependent dehydrogenase (short-subunit alcohol dehydrogenase family)